MSLGKYETCRSATLPMQISSRLQQAVFTFNLVPLHHPFIVFFLCILAFFSPFTQPSQQLFLLVIYSSQVLKQPNSFPQPVVIMEGFHKHSSVIMQHCSSRQDRAGETGFTSQMDLNRDVAFKHVFPCI